MFISETEDSLDVYHWHAVLVVLPDHQWTNVAHCLKIVKSGGELSDFRLESCHLLNVLGDLGRTHIVLVELFNLSL